tara:strand:- start:1013 stop:1645 length:633 start_codon:yes stop_codon:yes gene_type:complete
MDWRTILKFDENLYNHTDEQSKEKHRRILEFIKDRPKTNRTGQKIQEFLQTGNISDKFDLDDLPTTKYGPVAREFYERVAQKVGYDRDIKQYIVSRVNDLISQMSLNIRTMGRELLNNITYYETGVRKLIRHIYYDIIPKNFDLEKDEIDISGNTRMPQNVLNAIYDYFDKFDNDNREINVTLSMIDRTMGGVFLPNRQVRSRNLRDLDE